MKQNTDIVDVYITTFPIDTQAKLHEIRQLIKMHAPQAIESIRYGMPAYKTHNKPLVYFAGYDKHIGFYATPTGHEAFKKQLSKNKQGKGSVQFPLDQNLPLQLISEIVKFRVKENNKLWK